MTERSSAAVTAEELADSCFSASHPGEGASYPSVLAAIERALSISVAQCASTDPAPGLAGEIELWMKRTGNDTIAEVGAKQLLSRAATALRLEARLIEQCATVAEQRIAEVVGEIERLRDALRKIADTDQYPDHEDTAAELREVARNALAGVS